MTESSTALHQVACDIKSWASELGFQQCGITDTDLTLAESRLHAWLGHGYQGDMEYMSRHGVKRSRPAELEPGTLRVVSVRMNYLPDTQEDLLALTQEPAQAFLSRYALGRDYHKLLRKRLQQLADRITSAHGKFGYRVFVDSAPVLEKPIAEKAGLGWIGKHSNLISRDAGSWFFLGELYVDLPLPIDEPSEEHCGSCSACIDICPTQAIVEPFVVDARRCISYLTIELHDAIPLALRKQIGNRIYGCDDCQAVCPWNRFSQNGAEEDFLPRHELDQTTLLELFSWDEETFLNRTEGSAIRRIGYQRWQRNLAVALGNSKGGTEVISSLQHALTDASPMVKEHIAWALSNLCSD
ncbi:tRNA epoxyqueuosine(34) reductase QueG [Solemya elarraichensis gill symbiont]|uniref:Epoxyqueuosine reductase n=1 Tax=Solemya elarraichensis gill symbiont TaxID=1918949 RepID=A0A1T2L7X8_9GAMM|nr:tRNA epoxyqueuosine(34) reductase QueG [Solemya elarraichensis gill symbiont]OOZ41215.1 tRNA epoxyqueuosine(34) reductase QueG [Solemya elarraichensis gill symbiont]